MPTSLSPQDTHAAESTLRSMIASLACCTALMAIIAVGTFLGGTLGPTPHKIAVVMTVTVFHSMILCQYVGCTPRGCQVR